MILHLIFYFVVFCVIFAYNILDNGYIPFIVDIIFVSISIISVVVCMILRAGIKCSFETEMLTVRRNEKMIYLSDSEIKASFLHHIVNSELNL